MDSAYAVTTLWPFYLAINGANTDQICGPTVRRDHSNTSIHNSQ